MSRLLIKGGRVIDPANQLDAVQDIYVDNGKITAVGQLPADFEPEQVIDANELLVIPGVVDLCARLREPGFEHKAHIASETVAAAHAGITTLCCPPDTDPVIDEPSVVELIHRRADDAGHSQVITLGALTAGLKGELLSEMAALQRAGCVGVTNARHTVMNSQVLRRAFEYAATFDLTVFIEPHDPWLGDNGCAHEGAIATRLGLPGIPASTETTIIARDLELIAETGVCAHFGRLSAARSVDLISAARQHGMKVSADVAAHQLYLTEMDLNTYNSDCHVVPPFRLERDRDSLRRALADGSIQVICSDHQPHEADAKLRPFPDTEPGISGLETLLPLTLKLVDEGILNLSDAVAKLTSEPATILGISAGNLSVGANADICVIDPSADWTLTEDQLLSRGKNTPFIGWDFSHRAKHTLIAGKLMSCNH